MKSVYLAHHRLLLLLLPSIHRRLTSWRLVLRAHHLLLLR